MRKSVSHGESNNPSIKLKENSLGEYYIKGNNINLEEELVKDLHKECEKDNREAKIVAFGDSLTFGYGITREEDKWTNILSKELGCEVINAGVCGNTSSQGLERIYNDVLIHKPDYVIINFGMNDHFMVNRNDARVSLEGYRNNILNIIRLVREQGASPILVIPHRFIEGCAGNGNMGEGASYYYGRHPEKCYRNVGGALNQLDNYCEVLRDLASELKIPVIDIHEKSKNLDLSSILITLENSSEEDGVHLNEKGARFYGDMLKEFFHNVL